jgi:hypothetical protein
MYGSPDRLPAFVARNFLSLITTSMIQGLNEIVGVDGVMH